MGELLFGAVVMLIYIPVVAYMLVGEWDYTTAKNKPKAWHWLVATVWPIWIVPYAIMKGDE